MKVGEGEKIQGVPGAFMECEDGVLQRLSVAAEMLVYIGTNASSLRGQPRECDPNNHTQVGPASNELC